MALVVLGVARHQRLEDPRPGVLEDAEEAAGVLAELGGAAGVRAVEVGGVHEGGVLV